MQPSRQADPVDHEHDNEPAGPGVLEILAPRWRLLLTTALGASALGLAIAFALPAVYTARTTLLPPQQQQSAAVAALASLGALGNLAGAAAPRSPAEQFVALMRSHSATDPIIDRFGLLQVYDVELRHDARRKLLERTHIAVGRKDGMIVIEVEDHDPARAAGVANAFVDQLRRLTAQLAVSEAQQRRAFFAGHLAGARDELARAQRALQGSGFDPGALRAEPRAAAETYARLKAQLAATEVRLQALRSTLQDDAPEIVQTRSTAAALRSQLAVLEQAPQRGASDADYVSRFREFKYQESLFEMFARQYEAARLDESREGALIQVVDAATPPEKRSGPRRGPVVLGTLAAVFAAVVTALVLRARRSVARS